MTLLFILAIRELGSSLFLYTSNTMVMAVLLLDYYEGGNTGKTAAFSLVQTVLLARADRRRQLAVARARPQGSVGARRMINETKGGAIMQRRTFVKLAGALRRRWR